MSRTRQPTKVLQMKGTYKYNAGRLPQNEPEGDEFDTTPPKGFLKEEKLIWDEIIAMAPPGVLQQQDRFSVEVLTRLMARHRKAKGAISSADMTKLLKCLTELGFTPASRGKVVAGKQKDKGDGWDNA